MAAHTSRPRVPAATSRGLPARCLPRRRPSARLASSHATAIRATATAESCPKRAFSQPFPRSRASQNNSHSHHAIRQDASRQEVSRLSPLCTLSHCSIAAAPHTCRHGLGLKRTRQSTLAARQHDNTSQRACQRSPAYANTTARAPAHGSRQQDSASSSVCQPSQCHLGGSPTSLFSPTPNTRHPTPALPFRQAHRNAAGVRQHDERGILASILAASAEAL